MKYVVATIAAATVALAGSSLAHAATMAADPALSCYPEGFGVFLPGEGFTPNARVDFSRDGTQLEPKEPILADAGGTISANLTLPGMLSGQDTLNYVATDSVNPANTAALSLLVTATDVGLKPEQGSPERLLRIRARGFFRGGKSLWAHIVRGKSRRSRNVRIGRIKGPCKKVRAKRRLFSAGAPSGKYRVQFDAFRHYRKRRAYERTYRVTITRTVEPAIGAAGSGGSAWSRVD